MIRRSLRQESKEIFQFGFIYLEEFFTKQCENLVAHWNFKIHFMLVEKEINYEIKI